MKGIRYQLKNVLHDKFCLMTFLLPIIVAAVLNFAGSADFSALEDFHFGVLKEDLDSQTIEWLEQYGTVAAFGTQEELQAAVNEPSTNLIGVEAEGEGIGTILSGDELEVFWQIAHTLPGLYSQREPAAQMEVQILERPDKMEGLGNMLIVVTLIVAMFMGCTFNAMNMISEKEDGVAFVNEILPMSHSQYILQKLVVGFVCGCMSSMITACICFRISLQGAAFMVVLIVFSSFVAALTGLFVGKVSAGMMTGVAYIKIIMLLFIAVPVLSFLAEIPYPFVSALFYLVPSQAAFEGMMGLLAGSSELAVKDIMILFVHCMLWFWLYLSIAKRQKKKL